MKLALLGCDDEALSLVRAALAGGHELVAAYDTGRHRPSLHQLAPMARLDDSWESLLATADSQVVVVARGRFDPSAETGFSGDERRADQLRKLAAAAVPLIVAYPACEMIVGYELEMIRAGSGGVMIPLSPQLHHPAVDELHSLMASEDMLLGSIEQITMERQMADRSRAAVLTQFARDAGLLRRLVGTIRQVSATGAAGNDYRDPLGPRTGALPALTNLSVHLSGQRPFPARWSVGPVDDLPGARLSIVGAAGRAVLQMPEDPDASWKLDIVTDERRSVEFGSHNPLAAALAQLEAAQSQVERTEGLWLDVCRDVEAASVIDRSLEKGRAVALHTDEVSEEQSFKGVMAVGGCLVLAVTLLGVMLVVLVEALQLDFRRSPAWRLWPVYLVVPIVVFLALQTLQIVAKRSRHKQDRGEGAESSPAGDGAD